MKVEDIDKDLDALLKRIKDLDKYLIDIGAPHKDINIDVYDPLICILEQYVGF